MRKIILILIVCFASVYSSFSQILFLENFENVELKAGVGNLSSAWTLYNDKNIPSANYSYCDKAWKVIKNGNGKVAVSPSWFQSTNTKADRWMVSPPINLNSQSFPFLCFKAKSVDKIDKENYMIAISQTNTQKKAFTDTLLFVNEASADWTEQCIDLKKYKGANVHLAFILQSSDKYALYIDDIEVLDLCKPIVKLSNLSLPLFVSKSMPISFWALANYKSKDSIQSYTINYSLNNHLIFSSKVLNVEIPTFAQKEIPVQSFQLDTNGVYSFSLWLSDFNGIENTVSDTLTQQIEVTDKNYYGKNTLLECFSSSTCGPCAKANPFIQDAYKTIHQELENQDKFFMLKYQIDVPMPGDPAYTAEGKHQFNKYEGAGVPLLRLNGKSYSVDGNWELLVSDLHSQIQKIWNEKTQFQLKASMQRVQNDYKVEIHIENVGAYSHPVLLYLAFTEDSIFHTPQSNGETKFYHIMRKLLPDAYGQSLLFPSSIDTTLSFQYHFDLVHPYIFNGLNGLSAIVYLQDSITKEILQSISLPPLVQEVTNGQEKRIEPSVSLYPNPCKDKTYLDFYLNQKENLFMEICDLNGKIIQSIPSQWYGIGKHTFVFSFKQNFPGVYILKISGAYFKITKKIIVVNFY